MILSYYLACPPLVHIHLNNVWHPPFFLTTQNHGVTQSKIDMEETVVTIDFGQNLIDSMWAHLILIDMASIEEAVRAADVAKLGPAINGLSLFELEDSCPPLPLPIENEEIKVAYMHATKYTKSLHALNDLISLEF